MPSPTPDRSSSVLPPPPWSEAPHALRTAADDALRDGLAPAPILLAYDGDDALAAIRMRPFGSGELMDAMIELLALVLPLGADRLAWSLPGRAWSLEDPIPPVGADVDLRAEVVLLITADAHEGPCTTSALLHPVTADQQLAAAVLGSEDEPLEFPTLEATRILLDGREGFERFELGREVARQLARVIGLGHQVVLERAPAERLRRATEDTVGRTLLSERIPRTRRTWWPNACA